MSRGEPTPDQLTQLEREATAHPGYEVGPDGAIRVKQTAAPTDKPANDPSTIQPDKTPGPAFQVRVTTERGVGITPGDTTGTIEPSAVERAIAHVLSPAVMGGAGPDAVHIARVLSGQLKPTPELVQRAKALKAQYATDANFVRELNNGSQAAHEAMLLVNSIIAFGE